MADKKEPEAVPGEPGSEEWEKNDKVLRGEVEPGTGDQPEPTERTEEKES